MTGRHVTDREPEDQGKVAGEPACDAAEDLSARVEALQTQLEEAVAARQRALADFANYQRRAADNEYRALQSGAANLIRSLLVVLDNFDLALELDTEKMSVDQLLGGLRIVHDELVKVMENQGVQRIKLAIGDEFDPNRHEAAMRQPSRDVPPNHISAVLQPGYIMGELVLRPAKVAVAAPPEESGDADV